jgi:pyruvate dehydrogenase E1 component
LNGEGLQHEDGHSHILASTIPSIVTYDPAFAYEVAFIIRNGLIRMCSRQEDIFYYVTLYNENIQHPAMPQGVEEDLIRGLYLFRKASIESKSRVQLFGSGSIMKCVLEAQAILAERYGIAADVWSATSYQQLRNEALSVDRWNRLHPEEKPRTPFVAEALASAEGPVVAASDFLKLVPDMIRPWVRQKFVSLGTDGFGRSDTREALRHHFEVDAQNIVVASLYALHQEGKLTARDVAAAIRDLGIDPEKLDPLHA